MRSCAIINAFTEIQYSASLLKDENTTVKTMDWTCLLYIYFLCLFLPAPYVTFPSRSVIKSYKVSIDTQQYVYQIDERFLSLALGSSLIRRHWENFNFSSVKLQELAKGLAPAYLRMGGTDEDFLLFKPDKAFLAARYYHTDAISHDQRRDDISHQQHTGTYTTSRDQRRNNCTTSHRHRANHYTNFTMTTKDVHDFFTFAKQSDLNIIFGLNVLLRDSDTHCWNSTNAEELMKYIISHGFSCGWELGNEPIDLQALINKTTTGEELASDFKILRKLLNDHPEYGHMIVGPDISSPWRPPVRDKFLKEFLTNINDNIDGLTYHQYYMDNQQPVSKFYNPDTLDDLITEMQQVQSIMKESGASSIKLWLGETSSAYDGGVPGVSDSYVAGFMWLDKLGIAARLRHDVVIRQTFYGGSYSLTNTKTLDPFPDYWSSFLHKNLVGSRVLEVHGGISLGRTVRVYAHCTSKRSGYDTGSLVLIALNTQHSDVKLVLINGLEKLPVHQYLLTPGQNNNLTSQTVRLNGKLLQLVNDTFLPNVVPKTIPPDDIMLPPVSYGFFVIPDAKADGCKESNEQIIS